MAATLMDTGHVGCAALEDGLFVQLSGELGEEQLDLLRAVLLVPLPAECRDVVVDAGEVDALDDAALAVLVAAREWVEESERRFLLSRTSPALEEALARLGCEGGLPRLHQLPAAGRRTPRLRVSG